MAVRPAAQPLRDALRQLVATGPDGFEGLMATLLSELCGRPFRLAASGSQHGRDGSARSTDADIAFEAKLYTGRLPKKEVFAKIPELLVSDPFPDLWILGATVEVSAQIVDVLDAISRRYGLAVLILDWSPAASLPRLALLCAMVPELTVDFLSHRVAGCDPQSLAAYLQQLREMTGFDSAVARLRDEISSGSIGMPIARALNKAWLAAAFSDRRRARIALGQQLSPAMPSTLPVLDRPAQAEVVEHLTATSRKVLVVSGGEGCGKSWLVAKAWLTLDTPPVSLVIPARAVRADLTFDDPTSFIIGQVQVQTDDPGGAESSARWKARLSSWTCEPVPTAPHMVVVIDGLNENSARDWALIIDRLMEYLERRGCNLIVTVRDAYFRKRVRPGLDSPHKVTPVGDWNETELDTMLSAVGLIGRDLAPSVQDALRNPRMFSIAVDLYERGAIAAAAELSKPRLLFEHLRHISAGDPMSSDLFVRQLADHANDILVRCARSELEDRFIFDSLSGPSGVERPLGGALVAVTQERYVVPLAGDATRYRLSDDGLVLALGIAIVRAVQRAELNETRLAEALDSVLEPVRSLDLAADAMGAALVVASIDSAPSVQAALIEGYLGLQNLSVEGAPAFASAIRQMPAAAMMALRRMCDTKPEANQTEWLTSALRDMRNDPETWSTMADFIRAWLRIYSLSPERRIQTHRMDENHQADLIQQEQALRVAFDNLGSVERSFISEMTRDDAASHEVARQCFYLLAGMPLAPFAHELVCWGLGRAINSGFHDAKDDFLALVRFNTVDWETARAALLSASAAFADHTRARPARWARVLILRATATDEDCLEAETLVDVLTADQESFKGWRLVEKYCATDPCDPAAEQPENIDGTAVTYAALDVAKVRSGRWIAETDHLFDMARCGLARFQPDAAIEVHRRFAVDVVTREVETFRFGSFELEEHCVLIEGVAADFAKRAAEFSAKPDPASIAAGKTWVAEQFALMLALPHFDGDGQLAILTSLPPHGSPLVRLEKAFRAATPKRLEQGLRWASEAGDANHLLMLLCFAHRSGTPLTGDAISIVARALEHESGAVRGMAMAVLSEAPGTRAELQNFADSGWRADAIDDREHHLEHWHGSNMLIAAAEAGLLDEAKAIARIGPDRYSHAARRLGQRAAVAIQLQLDRALQAIRVTHPLSRPPSMALELETEEPAGPHFLSLSRANELTIEEGVRRSQETDEEYTERQIGYRDAYLLFKDELSEKGATLVINHVGLAAIRASLAAKSAMGLTWAEFLLSIDARDVRKFFNLAVQFACALSDTQPALAARLFDKFKDHHGHLRITIGAAKIQLIHYCLWHSARSPELDALRERALLEAVDDAAIAEQVIAAIEAGEHEQLRQSIKRLFGRKRPVLTARAYMILGFSDGLPEADALLGEANDIAGIVAQARRAARYAFERNVWTRHWYAQMAAAQTAEDYWRFSALFLKIADGRFDLWRSAVGSNGEIARRFEQNLHASLKRRIDDWEKKRKGKLFGEDGPAEVFYVPRPGSPPSYF